MFLNPLKTHLHHLLSLEPNNPPKKTEYVRFSTHSKPTKKNTSNINLQKPALSRIFRCKPSSCWDIGISTWLFSTSDPLKTHWKKINQWVDLRENLQETIDFPMKIMRLSCNLSLKPINWSIHHYPSIHLSIYYEFYLSWNPGGTHSKPIGKNYQNSSKSPRPLRLRWLRPRPRCHPRLAIAGPRHGV